MKLISLLGTTALLCGATAISALAQAPQSATSALAPSRCMALSESGRFSDTQVVTAKAVPAEPSQPGFCEITAVISPEPGSRIGVVYRLPDSWNGKVLGLGGGGFAGNVTLAAALPGLQRGYATLQTDAGHPSAVVWDTDWAVREDGSPNLPAMQDFADRAVHLMAQTGKQIVTAFYERAPQQSYFQGCSQGGRQGLAEVQRFPADFNGVIAGAPAMYSAARTTATLIQRAFSSPATRLSDAQVRAVHREVLRVCDALDGAVDGIIGDPAKCHWDPAPLACGNGPECLSAEQVDAVRQAYTVRRSPNGEIASYGVAPGSEFVTLPFFITMGKDYQIFTGYNKFGTAEGLKPGEDLTKNDVVAAREVERTSVFGTMMRADNPDISPFIHRGGKLLLWHGMYDQLIPYRPSIDYFTTMRRVTAVQLNALGEADRLDDSARLFLAAGVTHCRGGDGPSDIDLLTALEQWVEQGAAPVRILAKQPAPGVLPFPHTLPHETPDTMTRPLCAWPAEMHFNGKGDVNDAANFSCVASETH